MNNTYKIWCTASVLVETLDSLGYHSCALSMAVNTHNALAFKKAIEDFHKDNPADRMSFDVEAYLTSLEFCCEKVYHEELLRRAALCWGEVRMCLKHLSTINAELYKAFSHNFVAYNPAGLYVDALKFLLDHSDKYDFVNLKKRFAVAYGLEEASVYMADKVIHCALELLSIPSQIRIEAKDSLKSAA